MKFKTIALALAAGLLPACGILYTNVHVPRSYRSATPKDVQSSPQDKTVTGRSCSTSVLFLFAWGNAGYAAAARDALKDGSDAVLYDVRADSHLTSVLGLYTRYCTVVTGKAGQR